MPGSSFSQEQRSLSMGFMGHRELSLEGCEVLDQICGAPGGQVLEEELGHERVPARLEALHLRRRDAVDLAPGVLQDHFVLVPLHQEAAEHLTVPREELV